MENLASKLPSPIEVDRQRLQTFPTTAEIIAHIESSGNQFALRYEPNWNYITVGELNRCKAANMCDTNTARVICKTSFGLFQIMFSHIYSIHSINNKITLYQFLSNKAVQEEFFYAFLQSHDINFTGEQLATSPQLRNQFARVYNGDEDAYSEAIEEAIKYLQDLKLP